MKKFHSLIKVAASVSLACGIAAAAAGPALAASPNEASGAPAPGLISAAPLGLATFPGTSPVTVANVNIAGLLTTGVVTDTADATSASSTIANPTVTLSPLASLAATAVTSSCQFDPTTGTVSGTSGITGGTV